MSAPVLGITSYLPSNGSAKIVCIKNGALWTYNGSTATKYAGSLSTTGTCRMIQVNDLIYGVDGAGTIFKFDGSSLTTPTINNAAGTALTGVADIMYMFNRLWFAVGDYVYFSDTLTPETINEAPLRIRAGAGDTIARILSYRYGYILVFKTSTSGNGSIHVIDATSNDPDYLSVSPLYENIALISPNAICRAGYDSDSDILFPTREGFRSLKFTALDKITTPSLPFSDNITTEIGTLNYTRMDAAWAVVFEDELLWFVPTTGSTTPNRVFAWTFREPARKEEIRQGWTVMDNMPARCGVVAAITGKPLLWLGAQNGYLQKAFQVIGDTTTYREKSKRIDMGEPTKDKRPLKLIYVFDKGSSGTVTPKLQYEDGEIYPLSTYTFDTGGATLPVTLPVTLGQTGISTQTWDLRYDGAGGQLRRYQDLRIILESTGDPRVLGFELLSQVEKHRFTRLAVDQGYSYTASDIGGDTLTADVLTQE